MNGISITILGIVAGTCTTISVIPQVMKTIKTRQTKDLSLCMYSLLTLGIILWLAYGLLISDTPIIIANSVTLVLVAIVLVFKLKYG